MAKRGKSHACPAVFAKFHGSVNMTPAEILAWAKKPESKEYSWESTRRRLPGLAKLKGKARGAWTAKDCTYAQRVINFNTRMGGAARTNGCTRGYAISLRNWGRRQCEV